MIVIELKLEDFRIFALKTKTQKFYRELSDRFEVWSPMGPYTYRVSIFKGDMTNDIKNAFLSDAIKPKAIYNTLNERLPEELELITDARINNEETIRDQVEEQKEEKEEFDNAIKPETPKEIKDPFEGQGYPEPNDEYYDRQAAKF